MRTLTVYIRDDAEDWEIDYLLDAVDQCDAVDYVEAFYK